jgi:hypothetical protein
MAKSITKMAYTYAELLEFAKDGTDKPAAKAVERAKDWMRKGADDFNWWDESYRLWKQALGQIGFTNADIRFSGFSSQGDGASFTAGVDLPKLIAFLAEPRAASNIVCLGDNEDFRGWIVKSCGGVRFDPKHAEISTFVDDCEMVVKLLSSRYCHERTCGVEADCLSDEANEAGHKLWSRFVDDAEQLRLDLSRAIYKFLEAEHDSLTCDEALADTADANGYLFLANGTFEEIDDA